MPRPIFIICSEHMSVDRDTEFLSLFRILEGMVFRKKRDQSGELPKPNLPLKVVSTWMKEEGEEPDQEYEFRFGMRMPKTGEWIESNTETITFDGPFQKFFMDTSFPDYDGPGTMWFVGQMRKKGEKDWISHEYPVVITERTEGE